MKRFMLISRIFLALIFLLAVYFIYNPWTKGQPQDGEQVDNIAPIAIVGARDTRATLLRGGVVHLNGQGSFDPDGGDIVNYRWTIVDAPHLDLLGKVIYNRAEPQVLEQKYNEQDIGVWVYELEVTDDEGSKHSDVKKVAIQEEVTSIIEPKKKLISEVDGLNESDLVLGISINNEAMAYPAKFVYPYGVVNDTVGGNPVVIFFCEACQTGAVKRRTVRDMVLTFITLGGTLEEENFIIIDKETNSSWHAAYGTAESGSLQGEELTDVDFTLTTWREWINDNPDSMVLVGDVYYP